MTPPMVGIPDRMVRVGLLRETTGRKRNRVYLADEVLRLLDARLDRLPPATP